MTDSDLTNAGLVQSVFRNIFRIIDDVFYGLLVIVFQVFFNVASAELFTGEALLKFVGRVQLILGVFTMFQLAMSILKGIVNPDQFFSKDKGFSNVITKVVISLFLLAVIMPISIPGAQNEYEKQVNNNGILFGTLYSLQHRLLSNNTLGRLILGSNNSSATFMGDSDDELKSASNIFASTILKTFIKINLVDESERTHVDGKTDDQISSNWVCSDMDEYVELYKKEDVSPKKLLSYVADTCGSDDRGSIGDAISLVTASDYFRFTYSPIISTIVAAVFTFILLGFCVDVAVRAVKLSVLRIIAPVPIISYMNPNGGKDGALNSWVKTLTSTYLDLFIRLATVYFAIFLVMDIIANGIVINVGFRDNPLVGGVSTVLIFIGIFFFAKEAPKFLKDMLGLKGETTIFGGIGRALGIGAAAGGVIGSMVNSVRAAHSENVGLDKEARAKGDTRSWRRNVGRIATSAIGGAIGGIVAGGQGLMSKDASVKSVMDRQAQARALRASHSTFPGRFADSAYGMFTGKSLADADQEVLDVNKAAASSIGKFKSTAVAEAMKSTTEKNVFGTVSEGKDRSGLLRGIKFNKAQLEASMAAKDVNGDFEYIDVDGNSHSLNVKWFDSGVMGDIEDTQTARYLSTQWDSSERKFKNGKINVEWRQAAYDMSQSEVPQLTYSGDFLGQNTYDDDGNLTGEDNYGRIGKAIGAANDAVIEKSTNMSSVMHRANKQAKK